jgi:hypothetical protein
MKSAIVIFAAVVMIFCVLGYTYACIGNVTCPTCSCDLEFIAATVADNETKADVGKVTAQIVNNRRSIDVRIVNAYPGYEAKITFKIQNKGTLPIHIDEVLITGYDKQAIGVEITNLVACITINSGNILSGSETVRILQGAKQNWTYIFKVEARVSCQPLVHPRSVCFWTYEFSAALAKIKCEQGFSPSLLENYLNQIIKQSHVFAFTGTQSQKFKQALAILQTTGCSSMEAELKSQLLALWLNYVAGWTTGYALDKMTAYQIISGSENALIHHLTKQFEYWENLCERFNNLWDT